MASKLRPFRDYSEHDVINLFAHTNDTCDAGVIVKLNAAGNAWGHNGWVNIDASTKLSNENAMSVPIGNTQKWRRMKDIERAVQRDVRRDVRETFGNRLGDV